MKKKRMENRAHKYDIRMELRAAKASKILEKLNSGKTLSILKTASHLFMGGIMLMFFVGVALGVYETVWKDEPVTITLNYIMELAPLVAIGYFVKAFGENIAKLVLPYIFHSKEKSNNYNEGDVGNG